MLQLLPVICLEDIDICRNSIWRPPPSWIFTVSEFRRDGCLFLKLCIKLGSNISYNFRERIAENTAKGTNLLCPLHVRELKSFQLQGGGASPPDLLTRGYAL